MSCALRLELTELELPPGSEVVETRCVERPACDCGTRSAGYCFSCCPDGGALVYDLAMAGFSQGAAGTENIDVRFSNGTFQVAHFTPDPCRYFRHERWGAQSCNNGGAYYYLPQMAFTFACAGGGMQVDLTLTWRPFDPSGAATKTLTYRYVGPPVCGGAITLAHTGGSGNPGTGGAVPGTVTLTPH